MVCVLCGLQSLPNLSSRCTRLLNVTDRPVSTKSQSLSIFQRADEATKIPIYTTYSHLIGHQLCDVIDLVVVFFFLKLQLFKALFCNLCLSVICLQVLWRKKK